MRVTMEKIAGEREYLLEKLKETGVFVYGSSANYIFFKAKKGLWKDCMDRGISIRDFTELPCAHGRKMKNF